MRRIRSGEPGGHVLFEQSKRGRGPGIRLEVDHQIAVDVDARKLVDRLRIRLGDRLRGKSTPSLEPTWSLEPISGSATNASSAIVLENRTAREYIARVLPETQADVAPEVMREWIAEAVPQGGDGVGTEPTANTAGGVTPPDGKR